MTDCLRHSLVAIEKVLSQKINLIDALNRTRPLPLSSQSSRRARPHDHPGTLSDPIFVFALSFNSFTEFSLTKIDNTKKRFLSGQVMTPKRWREQQNRLGQFFKIHFSIFKICHDINLLESDFKYVFNELLLRGSWGDRTRA